MDKESILRPRPIETPLMKQYNAVKAKHPDAILLFRVGDFYETFDTDAVKTASILGITLTKRANGAASYVDLAGFPYHSLDTYLPKLVRAGQRVAICEQLEDPKLAKSIVKRGVTELVTPGVTFDDNVLERKENNFLASVYFSKKMAGVGFLDISTGEFLTAEGSIEYIDKLLQSFQPKEVLFEKSKEKLFREFFNAKCYSFGLDEWVYTDDAATDRLQKHFELKSLKGFGVDTLRLGVMASAAILYYLDLTEHHQVSHINHLSRIDESNYVWMDRFTIRNLELFNSLNEGAGTLIKVMDKTLSPMGARLLKRWVALPLKEIKAIEERHEAIDYFIQSPDEKTALEEQVKVIGDLERIVSKVAVGRINPREINQLKVALKAVDVISKDCSEAKNDIIRDFGKRLNACTVLYERIEKEMKQDPPVLIHKGNVIADGVSPELDEYRKLAHSGKDYLIQIQQREIELTGITSLKIGFNSVFGYYIEVRNTHKDKVPETWIRKQTLVSAERYITEELKEYETKILEAEEKMLELEQHIFNNLVTYSAEFMREIQSNARIIASMDCLLSFATIAMDYGYVRPEMTGSLVLDIRCGRHPVIERYLPVEESYITNDVYLDSNSQQIIIITGPNMAGKSALLRQTALIVLMAQCGSFIPAKSAKIGVVDKIFTRVGASDNISSGESTFMIEMNETASILNNISPRSLILLDEIGRGTSTYDGISIAWAIAEHIHEHPTSRAKTLFATHYHELNEMEKSFKRIKNYNVTVKEIEKKVIFLRKLIKGGTEHSFGIHVARMAGIPKSVVARAESILKELEKSARKQNMTKPVADFAENRAGYQLSFFQLEDPVLKDIRDQIINMDINNLTPLEALNKLSEIKKIAGL